MYCGGCLHGNTLVAALRHAGEDAMLLPVYTPLRTDEPSQAMPRVFFGGLNVYLQQKSALFRYMPGFVHRLLDHPALLRAAGRAAGSTRPEQLGALTVSMLRGEPGSQGRELDALLDWLADFKPDVVHLFSVLLAGMARPIAARLGVPVVCTLAGEDLFLEQLPPPHYAQARDALGERCADLAALIAMNRYFADFMADYLPVPRSRIHVIPPGLNLDGHARPGDLIARADDPRRTRTIGYLARIAPEKGLHLLAAAFARLATDPQLPPLRLRAAGYLAAADRPYLAEIQRKLAAAGLAGRFEYTGAPDRADKIALLQSFDVMGLPTVYRESKGLSVVEAWANGVPVVVPRHGAFPEMLADTGGGLLCAPNDPASLAAALAELLRDPARAVSCGRQAQRAVHDRYNAEQMAQQTIAVYKAVVRRTAEG